MSSHISIEFRGTYLHVHLPADYEINPKNVAELWSKIGENRKKYDSKRVLVEGTISSRQMTSVDAYDAGSKVGNVAPLRIACLFYNYIPDETTKFFKMVAANRGVLIEYFTDQVEALQWLGVNPDD